MKRNILYTLFILLATAFICSCSKQEYTCAIPDNAAALIAFDGDHVAAADSPLKPFVEALAGDGEAAMKVIDNSQPTFLFETSDGMMGLCAPLNDKDAVEEYLESDKAKTFTELEGAEFAVMSDSWVVGCKDNTLLAMGPVTGNTAIKKTMHRMAKLLNQDEEHDVRQQMLWEHLSEMKSPIRMVAKASALPEQMMAAVTIGAPKGTSASDVLIESEMTFKDGTMTLNGKACSYNPNIKQSLEKAAQQYQPLSFNWQEKLTDAALIGIFMNVDGETYMPFLQNNKALNTMLMGSDAYDKIRKNKGNMAVLLSAKGNSDDFASEVISIDNSGKQTDDRLVVVVNISAIKGSIAQVLTSLLGNTNRIIYKSH